MRRFPEREPFCRPAVRCGFGFLIRPEGILPMCANLYFSHSFRVGLAFKRKLVWFGKLLLRHPSGPSAPEGAEGHTRTPFRRACTNAQARRPTLIKAENLFRIILRVELSVQNPNIYRRLSEASFVSPNVQHPSAAIKASAAGWQKLRFQRSAADRQGGLRRFPRRGNLLPLNPNINLIITRF